MGLFKILKEDSHHTYKLDLPTHWKIYNRFYDCHLKEYYIPKTVESGDETKEKQKKEGQKNIQQMSETL